MRRNRTNEVAAGVRPSAKRNFSATKLNPQQTTVVSIGRLTFGVGARVTAEV